MPPLFVVGLGRSGTTLLQRVLNSIPGVAIWGEHGGWLSGVAQSYFVNFEGALIARCLWAAPKGTRDDLSDPRKWPAWTNRYDREGLRHSYRELIQECFRDPTAEHWGFKEIRYARNDRVLEMLADLYPAARFVLSVRNPVDQITSARVFFDLDETIAEMAHEWSERANRLRTFQLFHPERAWLVRYEDIADSRTRGLVNVVANLGFSGSARVGEILALDEARKSRKDLDTRPAKEVLGSSQIEEINRLTGPIRLELGY